MSCVQSALRYIWQIFVQIRLSENLNECHFTSLHDYHVVCSIQTSEHLVNFWTNSVFVKIRPLGSYRFRTYVILHCLNQIRIFYNFLVKTCCQHNICHHQIHKKCFKISFLCIVIPAKMIVACSLERRWIAESTRHRHERLAWKNVDNHWLVCEDWTGGAFVRAPSVRSCQMNKCHFTITVSCGSIRTPEHSGTFGKYSDKFGFRKYWITVPSRHFTTIMSSRLSCRVFNPHFGAFGEFLDKFSFRKNSAFG